MPQTDFPQGDETREILTATIDPTRDSEFNGVDNTLKQFICLERYYNGYEYLYLIITTSNDLS